MYICIYPQVICPLYPHGGNFMGINGEWNIMGIPIHGTWGLN
jgi:hypothetical protein